MAATTEYPGRSRLVDALRPLHQLLLHGLPAAQRVEMLAEWENHLEFVHVERGGGAVLIEAAKSATLQIAWRISSGSPSAMLPGVALLLAGIGTFLLALISESSSQMVGNMLICVASFFLGGVLVANPRVQPRTPLGIGCGLASAALAYYSLTVGLDVRHDADWLVVIGAALMSVGCATVAVGTISSAGVSNVASRAWGFGTCAVGAGFVAAAEIIWLLDWEGFLLFTARALAAVATLGIAFTAWRIREVPQEPEAPHSLDLETGPIR